LSDIFEASRVVLSCVVTSGTPKSNKATFSVKKDGAEFAAGDAAIEDGRAEYVVEKVPDVPLDKEFWTLTYSATVDGETINGSETHKVWPLKVTLKAVDAADTAVAGVPFTVVQNGEERISRTEPSGSVVHPLSKAAPFQVVIKKEFRLIEWKSTANRTWEAKVDTKVDPDFENVPSPLPAEEKHWVNLTSSNQGLDGNGQVLKCVCFAKGEGAGKAGKAGDKIWVHVKFERVSVRETPKPAVEGLTAMQTVVADVEFKGHVPLAADAGTAEFTLKLGLGGGDSCTVQISGEPDGPGPKRKIVNWRKMYYEILAPDWMGLEDNGGKKDMPAAARTALTNRADSAFFAYELHASQTFTTAEAPAGSVYDGAYFGGAAGDCYLLTDHTFTLYPKAVDKTTSPKRVILKFCRYNYFWDASCPLEDIEDTTEAATLDLVLTKGAFFKKSCKEAGGSSLRSASWEAVIDLATNFDFPACNTPADYTAPTGADDYAGKVTVRETNQNHSCDLVFRKPLGPIGNYSEDVSASERVKLDTLLRQCCLDTNAVKAAGGKLDFEIIGLSGNARRTNRLANVKAAIQTAFDARKKKVSKHPAVKDDGTACKGNLAEADISEVNRSKFKVTLPAGNPTDPGNLAGPLSATKCPIKVKARVEAAGAGLGLSGTGAQAGENLVFYNPGAVDASVDVALHELSHSLGLTKPAAWPSGVTARPLSYAYDAGTDTYSAGTAGGIYDGHGHSGWHCAYGIAAGDLGLRSYGGKGGTCVMFGENTGRGATLATAGFCPKCKEHLIATRM
jgi:hypothetical protein